MKKTKYAKYNENSVIRGALRRAFARSPLVQEVMAESRREVPWELKDGSIAKKPRVQRQCQVCFRWVGSTKISIDHIVPVVSVDEGFQDWNTFVARLWCPKHNLQRLCDTCHDKKTQGERTARLIKQYTEELDEITLEMNSMLPPSYTLDEVGSFYIKTWKKQLAKYIAKKKTPNLQEIVERAQRLKDKLK
jgi:5-methylcytosine-specific restriction endonuclease McrA